MLSYKCQMLQAKKINNVQEAHVPLGFANQLVDMTTFVP